MNRQDVKRMRAYRERNLILKSMGFDSYKKYLASDIWKSLRAFILKTNPKCFVCARPSTQVHHTIYAKNVLEGKSEKGLIATCSGCHFDAEFRDRDGKKLNPRQATTKMKQRRTLREKQKNAFIDWFVGEEKERD